MATTTLETLFENAQLSDTRAYKLHYVDQLAITAFGEPFYHTNPELMESIVKNAVDYVDCFKHVSGFLQLLTSLIFVWTDGRNEGEIIGRNKEQRRKK